MKKLLLIVLCAVFAKGVFAQTPQPLADNYIGCLGYTVVPGFVADLSISYVWYNAQTGGSVIVNNPTLPPLTISTTNFPTVGATLTFWVEPHLGSPTGPFVPGYDANNRIPVTVTRGDNCGEINPSGCYATGRLLFKEDYGGNLPTDPEYGPALPLATTLPYTYIAANVGGQHGRYTIKKTSFAWYSSWWENPLLNDHTNPGDPTRGYMFITDASTDPGQFYECTINNLCPGSRLSFSAWVVSMSNSLKPSRVNLTFIVEDAVTHKVFARFYTGDIPEPDRNWRSYGFHFVPTSPSIVLRIVNNCTTGTNGNDFCLDDIEVRLCAPPISMPNTEFSKCNGDNFFLHPTFNNNGFFATPLQYQWYFSTNGTSGWTPIPGQNNLDLNITNVSSSNVGYYMLAIIGAGGDIQNINCRSASNPVYLGIGAHTSVADAVCGVEPYWFGGELITQSGVYEKTFTMSGGCDSVVTLTISFSGGIGERNHTMCEGQTYSFYGNNLTTSGTYSSPVFHNAAGCDTIDRLHLTVNPFLRRTINASICRDESYNFYGTIYTSAVSGVEKRFPSPSGCDSVVTLNLTVDPYVSRTIPVPLCYGDIFYFKGREIIATTSGVIYKDTVPSATVGCDTIKSFVLIVSPVYTETPILTICESDLPYTWRNITFDENTVSGIFTYPLSSINGCDSTVTLNLTVNPSFVSNELDSICSGEIYSWRGNNYTIGGTYTVSVPSPSGCDSIFKLNLKVIDNVNVDVIVQEPVCADDGEFVLTITPKFPGAVLPTNYSIDFAVKETENGVFIPVNKTGNIIGNEILVEMPPKVYPNRYSFEITLSNNLLDCRGISSNIDFDVLYPDSIMRQKWDNVIALLNEYYNGGFRFVGYQWYHNGDPMPNETNSYIYLNESSFDVGNDKYSVKIEREDGSKILSCQLTAQVPKPTVSQYPTLVSPNSNIIIKIQGKTAVVRIWSVTGILVAKAQINSLGQEILAPSQQGVYLLEIISDNNFREITPIVVK